jgi:hypothetical protein
MSALFKRTGGEDFPDRLKTLISGPPKSGKTSLLGTVPNIVIADTEPHANNLQSVAHKNLPYVTINGTDDLQRLLFVLRDAGLRAKAAEQLGMPVIEAVGIDTIDTLQQIMKAERLRELRQSQFLRDDWAWLKDEMAQIIKAFTALPLHVFFVVHTKTSEVGKGDDARNIVLPALQGSFSEEVAGMVGYSLLSFRKQEIRPDGSPYTKYWLRAEGDETYGYLGNRAAGRLPDVIEPSFQAIYEAAMAGKAQVQTPVQPQAGELEALQAAPSATAPVAAEPTQVAQNLGQPAAAPAAAVAAPQPDAAPTSPANEEPVNAAALTHTKKVYDAIGLEFPEDKIRNLTLGDARTLVRMWQAIQQDAVEGKGNKSPAEDMQDFLASVEWLSDADQARMNAAAGDGHAQVPAPAAEAQIVPDINGTIEQVLAYVADDLARVQEAFDQESGKAKPRQTLLNALINKGAKVPTAVQIADTPPPAAPVAEPVAPVTQPAPAAEVPTTEEQAVQLLQEGLGAVPLGADGQPAPCEECGNAVDDEDIATLSSSRFKRRLCVADYIAETKKPRQAV